MKFKVWVYLLVSIQTSVIAQNFRVRHFIAQTSNSKTKEVFEISAGLFIGAGLSTDTSSGTAIGKLAFTGLDAQGGTLWVKSYGNSKLMYLNNPFTQRSMYKLGPHLFYAGCGRDTTGRVVGLLTKINLTGDTVWQKRFKSSDTLEDLIPQMVTPSIDGGFLLTGFYENFGNNTRTCLLLKTDANGDELWRRKISKSTPNVLDGKAILQDSASGKIVIGGYQYKNGNSNFDSFIITDSLGNNPILKSFTYSGGSITDLIQTYDKKIVAVGFVFTNVSLSGQPTRQPFAIKFDLNNPGNGIWRTPNINLYALYNGFNGVRELKNHDLLFSGFVDTISGVVGKSNMAETNLWVRFSKYDEFGNLKWNRYYNYKNNDSTVPYYQEMHSFNICQDGGWVGAIELANYGVNPFMFVRYDSTGCDTIQGYCQALWTTSLKEEVDNKKMLVYPNPTSDHFQFINSNDGEGIIELYDLLGKQVLSQKTASGQNKILVDVSAVPVGMYLLKFKQDQRVVFTTKVVREN